MQKKSNFKNTIPSASNGSQEEVYASLGGMMSGGEGDNSRKQSGTERKDSGSKEKI
jgi:hypothetical protein